MLKYIDAFAGIGGFSYGLKRILNNAECVSAIEYDKDASQNYNTNHKVTPLGDIRSLDLSKLPEHDLLMGGFPCQPFSSCGKWGRTPGRLIGEEEDRDNLFLFLAKILELKRPKYFLFENVKGILSVKNKDGSPVFDTIKKTFEDLNYTVYTKILDAADFSAAQQRKRMFFVGFREDQKFNFPKTIERHLCVNDILEENVNKKYLLEHVWRNRTTINGENRLDKVKKLYHSGKWDIPKEKTFDITPVAILTGDTPSGVSRQHDRVYSHLGISTTIHTFSPPAFDIPSGWRILTPRECARLQGFPESHIIPSRDNVAYKQFGNAVNVNVVKAILEEMLV